jgi:flavodoxin
MKIYYFTGTGNSHWVAKKIGEYFNAEQDRERLEHAPRRDNELLLSRCRKYPMEDLASFDAAYQ